MEEKQIYTSPVCDITTFEGADVLTASIIMPPHILGGTDTSSTDRDKI